MKKITPSKEGRIYDLWLLYLNYLAFAATENVKTNVENGFRLSAITISWMTIEAFMRVLLFDNASRNFTKLELGEDWEIKLNCWQKIKNLFRDKKELEKEELENLYSLKNKYLKRIEAAAWKELKIISEELGYPINAQTINHEVWEFMKHLYSLRNSFIHGVSIRILKSNIQSLDDELTKKYQKALKFLSKEKVLDLEELFQKQEINLILNKKVTDLIINKTFMTIDALADTHTDSRASYTWKKMKNSNT